MMSEQSPSGAQNDVIQRGELANLV
jgi:hypothetical protein